MTSFLHRALQPRNRRHRQRNGYTNALLRFCLFSCCVIAAHMILSASSPWHQDPGRFLDATRAFSTSGKSSKAMSGDRRRRRFELFSLGGSNDITPLKGEEKSAALKNSVEGTEDLNSMSQEMHNFIAQELKERTTRTSATLQLFTYGTISCTGNATNIATAFESNPIMFKPEFLPKSAKVQGDGLVEVFTGREVYKGSIHQSEGCVDFYNFFRAKDKLQFVLQTKEHTFSAKKRITAEIQHKFSTAQDLAKPHTRIVYSATSSDYFGYQMLANAFAFLQSNQTNASWMRLLSARQSDDVSEQFPTFSAPKSLYSQAYAPVNKADVIDKWFQSPDAPHPDDTIVVIDPDNWLLKDIDPWTKDVSEKQAVGQVAYYGWQKKVMQMWHEFCVEHCENKIDPVGVPYFVKASDLKEIAPLWRSYSIAIHQRNKENATFAEYYKSLGVGWAAEMFGYNFACAQLGIRSKVVDNLQLRDTSTSRDWNRWSKIPMIHMGRAWFPKNETVRAEQWRHEDDGGFSSYGIQVWCKCNFTGAKIQPWPLPTNMDVVSYHTLRILHESKEYFGPVPVNMTYRKELSPYWAAP